MRGYGRVDGGEGGGRGSEDGPRRGRDESKGGGDGRKVRKTRKGKDREEERAREEGKRRGEAKSEGKGGGKRGRELKGVRKEVIGRKKKNEEREREERGRGKGKGRGERKRRSEECGEGRTYGKEKGISPTVRCKCCNAKGLEKILGSKCMVIEYRIGKQVLVPYH
jgi:hypothetical protein